MTRQHAEICGDGCYGKKWFDLSSDYTADPPPSPQSLLLWIMEKYKEGSPRVWRALSPLGGFAEKIRR
jgi:hypothetical protein